MAVAGIIARKKLQQDGYIEQRDAAEAATKPDYDILNLWLEYMNLVDPETDEEYSAKLTTLMHGWAEKKGLPLSLFVPGKSPITPAEAPAEASRIIDNGLTIITLLNSYGVLAEAASLGQIESVIWAMTNIIQATGIPKVIQDLYATPTEIGLKTVLTYQMNRTFQPLLPDQGSLVELRARGMLSEDLYTWAMQQFGYPDWASEIMAYAKTRMPDPETLLSFLRRGYIDDDTARSWLRRTSLHPDAVEPMLALRWQLPGYAELISIYMKEGYLEEKWAEIPDGFIELMDKLGYDFMWALKIWGKHWVLPGVGLLYDMFHKEITDYDTMVKMLKYHDFEPVWRERLIANAYNMIPRVDLRRAYRYGYLRAGDLAQRYRWLGYKPGDAEIMSGIAQRQFLDRYYTQVETAARALFKEGLMNEEEFRGWLRKSGLPEEGIDLAVEAENLAFRLDYAKDVIALATMAFQKDVYNAEYFADVLAAQGMAPERIAAIVGLEELRKLPKPKAVA